MPESKEEKIAKTQANLPLPEQPPQAPDWQSADARTVQSSGQSADAGTGAGSVAGLREPATKDADMDMSGIGRQGDGAHK
ncbi:hypothetical protein CDD81_1985 [Ophiocordyceps australis]|uniref:Uncharacterized protein n=1 Tax=Ophiocordyceps australis TaxID=1399860 RepID=A0A2C5YDJ2_9HYPO|nr:hypothetical protein CDD81_1985 [Ophiocordyceps australis]